MPHFSSFSSLLLSNDQTNKTLGRSLSLQTLGSATISSSHNFKFNSNQQLNKHYRSKSDTMPFSSDLTDQLYRQGSFKTSVKEAPIDQVKPSVSKHNQHQIFTVKSRALTTEDINDDRKTSYKSKTVEKHKSGKNTLRYDRKRS